MTVFKVRHETLGDHVHCSLFAAKSGSQNFANCGKVVLRAGNEFQDFMESFNAKFESIESMNEAMKRRAQAIADDLSGRD